MRRRYYLFIIIAVLLLLAAVAVLLISGRPPEDPERPDPQKRIPPNNLTIMLFERPTDAVVPTQAASDKSTTDKKESKDKKLDFFKTFKDYPKHFVTHGVKPGEEMSSEFYFDATLEISGDGKITGTYFSNLDSTDDMTIENTCKWTGKIRDNKVYRDADGNYYFYLKGVKYDNKPGTTKETDGKLVKYVYGYGLSEKADNKIRLYAPGTPIGKIPPGDTETDIGQFLELMRKPAKNDSLDCFFIIGKNNSCYVSITDEEYEMAAKGDSGGEEPAPPEQPQEPEQPQQPPQP